VWCDNHVVHVPERGVLGQRLRLEDVESGPSEFAVPERVDERVLVDDAAAGLGAQVSSVVQLVLALVLIYLALSLVRIGYGNISNVRGGREPAAEPGDD